MSDCAASFFGVAKNPPIIKRGTGKYPINGNSNGKVIELNGVFPLTSPFFLVKSCQIPSNQHKTVFFHGFLPTFGPRCGARSWCFRFWRVHRKGSGTSSHPDLGKEAFGWEKHRKKKHKKSIFNECASSLPTRLIMSDVEMSDLSEVKVFQKRWWLNDGWMWTISCPQPRPQCSEKVRILCLWNLHLCLRERNCQPFPSLPLLGSL